MSQSSASESLKRQLMDQIHLEAGNEDLSGLNSADLEALTDQLWAWAENHSGDAAVRVRTEAKGATGDLQRSLLETNGPDMPFLVDSLLGTCAAEGFEVRTLFHPILKQADGKRRSIIQIHLPQMTEDEARRLEACAIATLEDVSAAVSDFSAMQDRMIAEQTRIAATSHLKPADREEAVDFLKWLSQDHFVFLGCREYEFETDKTGNVLPEEPIMVEGSNLGILRDGDANVLTRDSEPLVLTPEIGEVLNAPFPLLVAKSTLISRVHRRVRADYIGVKKYDTEGRITGEVRFLGLFTADAYDQTARSIPFIRRRVEKVIDASGATPGGHSETALANILENWPRDELFQTPSNELQPIIMGALHLIGRPRTRLFLRRDPFDRFVSAIAFVPRDAYDSDLRKKIGTLLTDAHKGTLVSFQPYFDSGPMARVLFHIALTPGHPRPDVIDLEAAVQTLAKTWDQSFRNAVLSGLESGEVDDGAQAFFGSFNAAYREAFDPAEALRDVAAMADLSGDVPILARAYRKESDQDKDIRVKIYARDGALALSRCVPVFENMGLFVKFETGYPIRPEHKPAPDAPDTYWIHDLNMRRDNDTTINLSDVAEALEDAFKAVWSDTAESDGFNTLVLSAGATWRQAALMRALCAYRRQTGRAQPRLVQIDALIRHPRVARHLLNLFAARFDPAAHKTLKARQKACDKILSDLTDALTAVTSLADDQVLTRLMHLINAVQRTNFYQRDETGTPRAWISFKIASRDLTDLPDPKPYREIFTASPVVDGVHLRFGAVARGGLRWSDRASDYRTEVLGLVKAQQVKNAVIVPVGSKGGFYPKALPDRSDRDAWFEGGREAYKQFITALLGLTDNLDGANVVHPENTVIWDGEDPYLVVAADKGTATFSDTANAISQAHGFWLGDAFASGGSAGYDHKKMGITARGAWEAVKRHFREMGKDIQSEPFTVIGVGDMSGDVFGNGMLLSKQTRLLAAFNHLHIFIDPNPGDPESNWAERKRLFDKDRSSWSDYNADLISQGGGVFERAAKSIPLSDEIRKLTGLGEQEVTPDILLHALLKAPTDLMWFGGIGTYVKASSESHEEAGDKGNDAIRVNADDLQAKVIGEGANLGVTQASRIEFARLGGHINTDAIDNSAGVDSSDHEVNIKILAAEAIRSGKLKPDARDALLADMTDDVAAHVLAHNYDQTFALTLASATAAADHEAYGRLMEGLEARGVLNRTLEGLPGPAGMRLRAEDSAPLTRPELAVLLAWSKIVLFDDIVASDLADDPRYGETLKAYFPAPIDTYGDAMQAHRLKREIIATIIANRTLDMGGPIALQDVQELTGATAVEATRGLEAARTVLDFSGFEDAVNALDTQVDAALQTDLRLAARGAMVDAACWFVRHRPAHSVSDMIAETLDPLNVLKANITDVLSPYHAAHIERRARKLVKRGAPESLARWAAAMGQFSAGLIVVDLAARTDQSVIDVADAWYHIGDQLRIDRLSQGARDALPGIGYWDQVAARRQITELARQQAGATHTAMNSGNVREWLTGRSDGQRKLLKELGAISREREWTFAKFALAADAVRQFLDR